MGWLSNTIASLTEKKRFRLAQFFGSFKVNQFALNDTNYLNQGYEGNIDVYSIINKIIKTSSALDWNVKQKQKDGSIQTLTDTPIHELMYAPNTLKNYSWKDINAQIELYLLANGNSYLCGKPSEGFGKNISMLDVLPSNLTDLEVKGDWFDPETTYKFTLDNKDYIFKNDEVAHFKYFNPAYNSLEASVKGLSPIQVAANLIQLGNDRLEADKHLTQNRGSIGMVTDRSNRPQTPAQAEKMQESFNDRVNGLQKYGQIMFTNKDLNYIQMAMSSTDLQLLEKGVVNLRSLCSVYGVDSSLFNDPQNQTYNNKREATKDFYTGAIMPLNALKAEQYDLFLVNNLMPNKGIFMEPDYSGIDALREDFHEKVKSYVLLKTAGVISANVAAAATGQPESDDENADKLIVSANTQLLENINNDQGKTETDSGGNKEA